MAKTITIQAASLGADLNSSLAIYHTNLDPSNFLTNTNKASLLSGVTITTAPDTAFTYYVYESADNVEAVAYLPGPSISSYNTFVLDNQVPAVWKGVSVGVTGSGFFGTKEVKFQNPNSGQEYIVTNFTASTDTRLEAVVPDMGTFEIDNIRLKITNYADPSQSPTTTFSTFNYYNCYHFGVFSVYSNLGAAQNGVGSTGIFFLSSPFSDSIKGVLDFGEYKYVYGDTVPTVIPCDPALVPADGFYVKESQRPASGDRAGNDFIYQITAGKVVASYGAGVIQP